MASRDQRRSLWSTNIFILLYTLCRSFSFVSSDIVFGNQPRFLTRNGDLFIIAAEGHNISLHSRSGYVNLNGENLAHLVRMARSSVDSIERFRISTLNSLEEQVKDLNDKVNGPHGIMKSIILMKESSNNSTANISIDVSGRNSLRSRVSRLFRRVNAIDTKVTYLYNLLLVDECTSNPCQNGGTCTDLYSNFHCHCPEGWEGPNCQIDVNECRNFYGSDLGCQNNAECENKPGTYECKCKPGWFGRHCRTRTNDCSSGNSAELCGHGTCINQGGTAKGFVCICDPGWEKNSDGACTKDVDECESQKSVCSHDPPVSCINVVGSFFCGHCPPGYTGNGYDCADIDECLVNNGGCSVTPFVQCINKPGSRICGPCPIGYEGDGFKCTYAGGACNSPNNGGCHPNARCVQNSGTYIQCICSDGYVGNGIGPNGCVPTLNPGAIVARGHPCSSKPCHNGGKCVMDGETTFTCFCPIQYEGSACEILRNPCSPNPCQNGGNCTSLPEVTHHHFSLYMSPPPYKCVCSSDFTGINCESLAQECVGRQTGSGGIIRITEKSNDIVTYNRRGRDCQWEIVVNETEIVNITFNSFKLEGSSGCKHDYLTIRDGEIEVGHTKGTYCGHYKPPSFLSEHNYVILTYHSDEINNGDGFELEWTAIQPECSKEIVVKSHGMISSPGSPGHYPLNRDCMWLLETENNERIKLKFYMLQIENSTDCSKDYLEIRDQPDEDGGYLEKLCGLMNQPPNSIVSSGQYLFLHFHSDSNVSASGFQLSYETVSAVPGCGGVFTSPNGEIKSSFINPQYSSNLYCKWIIQLAKGDTIKATFSKFSLEDSRDCLFDYVQVLDGQGKDARDFGKPWCGDNMPPTLLSTSNVMTVIYRTDFSVEKDGFEMKYEIVCGGTFTDPTGIISSPNYPNMYRSNIDCIYLIAQPVGKAISLNFIDFSLEDLSFDDSDECYFDYVLIRDGDNENSTSKGPFCTRPPNPILSTHNYLWLKFHSDHSGSERGFLANYTTIDIACGGIIRAEQGNFASPHDVNDPTKYMNNLQCHWIIIAPPGYVIHLTWLTFNLEVTPKCVHDYVEVFDNNTEAGRGGSSGKLCSKTVPPLMTSTDNVMTVFFKTDGSVNFPGFSAHFFTEDASKACGGNYLTTAGIIFSPNYPDKYPDERECKWLIQVPAQQQIKLHIEYFELEHQKKCKFDYLEIRNGGSDHSPLIDKYCGKNIPKEIVSFSNQLFLKFVSDVARTEGGFKITWDGSLTGCGGVMTAPTGSITSPNYPSPYYKNVVCFYRISVSQGSRIQFSVVDIELETNKNCLLDYIELHDGVDSKAKVMRRICTNDYPPHIMTSQNHLFIKFRSDISIQGRGFHVIYNTVCNTTVPKGFHGVIESPNFPDPYPHPVNCMWTIAIPKGNRINVTFSNFNLAYWRPFSSFRQSDNCSFNFVEITEYIKDNPQSNVLGKYCSQVNPPTAISSSGDKLTVQFLADEYHSGKGFRLEWVIQGCGGILSKSTEGHFSSPNYPEPYPHSTECDWYISVPAGHSIEITIVDFNMEKTSGCWADYLKIFGGPDDTSKVLAKLCTQKDLPAVITTPSNYALARFNTDGSYSGTGFSATYKAVASVCGGKFKSMSGTIHSKNFPQRYERGLDCIWTIEVPANRAVNLTFTHFTIESRSNCSTDEVKVYDGLSLSDPVILTHCGSSIPPPVISTGNMILVRHKNNAIKTFLGFEAKYELTCGARITATDRGFIDYSAHDNIDNNFKSCSWIIEADQPDSRITLTFLTMELGDKNSLSACEHAALFIYEGEDNVGEPIRRYCGTSTPPPFTSASSKILITVTESDSYWSFHRLSLSYSIYSTECGGKLQSENGTIVSKNYPDGYPPNIECLWTFSTAPGMKMQLQFTEFDLVEGTADNYCNQDYVEIREGSETGNLLGLFCYGTSVRPIVGSNLWVKFDSSYNVTAIGSAKGFAAEYTLLHHNEINGVVGKIGSPLYPLPYFHEGIFTWRVMVDFGTVISVTFVEFLSDSYTDENNNCFSYLEIFDGYDETTTVLLQHCGESLPEPVRSTSNVLFVKLMLKSSSIRGNKFLFDWVQVVLDIDNEEKLISDVPGCGGLFEVGLSSDLNISTVSFTSPGYPIDYPSQLLCTYIIQTTPGGHIQLGFKPPLALEEIEGCSSDFIEIFSEMRSPNDWKKMAQICYKNSTDLIFDSHSYRMKLVFQTDYYHYGKHSGFSAFAVAACGGELSGPSGTIDTTDYVNIIPQYINNIILRANRCSWNITVRQGRTIQVNFTKFNLPASGPEGSNKRCSDNYILLRNGENEHSPFLGDGKYCGQAIPVVPHTSGHYLHITYVGNKDPKGLVMTYQEISLNCNDEITLTAANNSVNISSPNYPYLPPPHSECVWIITAPAGKSVHVDFIERLDYREDCSNQYFELRDGATEISPLIGHFCETPPSYQMSSGNVLRIKFYSDLSSPVDGFIATVSLNTCGGTLFIPKSGEITSPNYPDTYPPNVHCSWRLVGRPNDVFNINFTKFSIGTFSEGRLENCPNETDTLSVSWVLPGVKVNKSLKSSSLLPWPRLPRFGLQPFHRSLLSLSSPNQRFPLILSPRLRQLIMMRYMNDTNGVEPPEDDGSQNTQTFCGNKIISPLKSPSNEVLIRFQSRAQPAKIYGKRLFHLTFNHTRSPCGGKLFASSGIIQSPKYPNERYVNGADRMLCLWDITVQRGRRIRLKILDFDLTEFNGELGRSAGSVTLFNGEHRECKIVSLQGFVPENTVYESSTNKMSIQYGPFHNTNHKGFKAEYTSDFPAICGGDLDEDEGFFTTPEINNNSTELSSFICEWEKTLNSSREHTVVFRVVGFIGDSNLRNCYMWNSMLQFSSRDDEDFRERLCSNYTDNNPAVTLIPFNYIKIKMQNVNTFSLNSPGITYNVSFKTYHCGGTIHLDSGEPYNYNLKTSNESMYCAWKITSDEKLTLKVHFSQFNLASPPCDKQYLELHNGPSHKSPTIGRFCGNSVLNDVLTQTNQIWITYHSDNSISTQPQLQFSVNTVNEACGVWFHGTHGSFHSPGYPTSYPPNTECEWIINVPTGYHVNLTFVGRFHLEDSTNCVNDQIEIYTFTMQTWSLITSLCGRLATGSSFQSDSSKMKVIFRSNPTINSDGFMAIWNLTCGGTVPASERIIMSPNYPNYYDDNLSCLYIIEAPGKLITGLFKDFRLEKGVDCKFDKVVINDHDVYCGSVIPPPIVAFGELKLQLTTDYFVKYPGFLFEFNIQECGGNITSPGLMESPSGETDHYLPGISCTWYIIAPKSKRVLLRFSQFHTELSTLCSFDSLSAWNVLDNDNKTLIGKYCGYFDKAPLVIKSDSNIMFVQFDSDKTNEHSGFRASVEFAYGPKDGCGGNIEVPENGIVIKPPDVDRNGEFEPNLECSWLFTTASNKTRIIQIEFLSFNLNKCFTKCGCDFLEIFDGPNQFSQKIDKYCELNNTQFIVTSSSDQVWMHFVSDSINNTAPGFELKFTSVEPLCGAGELIATEEPKILSSPSYPSVCTPGTHCTWFIRTNDAKKELINFHFLDLDIEKSNHCHDDILEISDNPPRYGDLRGEKIFNSFRSDETNYFRTRTSLSFCNRSRPADIQIFDKLVTVTFACAPRALGNKGSKFQLQYSIKDCSSNYTDDQGSIFFNVVRKNTNQICKISITAPNPNATVSLYLDRYTLSFHYSCRSHKLEVYDGPSSSSQLLQSLCDNNILPDAIYSTGPTMLLIYTSNRFLTSDVMEYSPGGIRMVYTTTAEGQGCGGRLHGVDGTFSSPFYPLNIRNNTDCKWDVSVPFGNNIKLRFNVLSLGSRNTCDTDFLEIYDVDRDTNEKFSKVTHCGSSSSDPDDYIGITGHVIVRYKTSVHNTGLGWKISYSAVRKLPI